jgi:hypothetical protein
MGISRSISRALGRAISWPLTGSQFGTSGGETAFQQAVIGAWDMQEPAATDVLPQKGDITLANVLTSRVSFGATGLVARSISFSGSLTASSSEVFLLPNTGAKTFRYWTTGGHVNFMGKLNSGSGNNLGDEYRLQVDEADRMVTRFRNAADTSGGIVGTGGDSLPPASIQRCEVCFDADAGQVRLYAYDYTGDTMDTSVTGAGEGFNRALNDFVISRGTFCLLAIFDRALTAEEREADKTPTRFADLGK